MIRRAPRPDQSFLILRNDVARDARLSYRASGILADILSRPDDWTTSAEALAKARPDGEGIKAIRAALTELERAGYLRRQRIKVGGGRFDWVQSVYDYPVSGAPGKLIDVSAGRSISPKPPGGNHPAETALLKKHREEDLQEDVTELDRPASGRSAPSGGAQTEILTIVDDGGSSEPDSTVEGSAFTDWRSEDRKRFWHRINDIAGGTEVKILDTSTWNPKGNVPIGVLYDSFRKYACVGRKPLKWPGAFLEELYARNPDHAVADWLVSQGMEAV